ncbi:MAG: TRAP transporter permease [Gammaproteobacteria bacterium]
MSDQASQTAAAASPAADDPHNIFGQRSPIATRTIFWIAAIFSVYQIYTAAYAPLSSLVMRSLHVGFLMLLAFAALPTWSRGGRGSHWLGWTLGIVGFALGFYQWIFEEELILRSGELTTLDLWIGIAALALVFEAARRVMGPALPLICAAFLAYALFGQYLPGALAHRGYGLDQVINQMSFGTEGIYGIPTYVSSTYIFLFILFGTFLEQAGMIRLFTDFSLGTVGHTRGGPAKVSVVASGLMGTINGSGVANVVTTGQFTIPLMKRFGYRPAFAGGVEATSSMGGQIMPPVMGAVAFIMAETIGVPYLEIVKAALIPAILYFATAFWMVHLEAGRLGLVGIPKEECPDPWAAVRRSWYLILPLAALVWLLFAGYTPLFSGTVGLAATVILIFGAAAISRAPNTVLRFIFWIGLGLLASSFLRWGITAVFAVIGLLIAVNLWVHGGREVLRLALNGLSEGAKNALSVGVACALVGVIIGVMTLTGAATTFGGYVIRLGEHSLFLSLLLTMLTCLVLGMGIPTIPNYIITSSLAAPALLEMGVPLIVSHMFVFYFGIMADLTPPVALAAYAASPIARASGLAIGVQAMRIAIAGFVVPFMAVYAPALMLQSGTWVDTAYVVFKALLAIGLWGAASIGYLWSPLSWPERILAAAGAFMLVVALPITDEIGFALCAAALGIHWLRSRKR